MREDVEKPERDRTYTCVYDLRDVRRQRGAL